jgi:hypothetical protein
MVWSLFGHCMLKLLWSISRYYHMYYLSSSNMSVIITLSYGSHSPSLVYNMLLHSLGHIFTCLPWDPIPFAFPQYLSRKLGFWYTQLFHQLLPQCFLLVLGPICFPCPRLCVFGVVVCALSVFGGQFYVVVSFSCGASFVSASVFPPAFLAQARPPDSLRFLLHVCIIVLSWFYVSPPFPSPVVSFRWLVFPLRRCLLVFRPRFGSPILIHHVVSTLVTILYVSPLLTLYLSCFLCMYV